MYLFGGLRRGDVVIGVTHIPNRKRPCLYIGNGNVIRPLAYFANENDALFFWEMFQEFEGVARKKGEQ